jgi:hypothetical protein
MSGAKTRTDFRGDNGESLAYIIKKQNRQTSGEDSND